jgi:hypothetical protein
MCGFLNNVVSKNVSSQISHAVEYLAIISTCNALKCPLAMATIYKLVDCSESLCCPNVCLQRCQLIQFKMRDINGATALNLSGLKLESELLNGISAISSFKLIHQIQKQIHQLPCLELSLHCETFVTECRILHKERRPEWRNTTIPRICVSLR